MEYQGILQYPLPSDLHPLDYSNVVTWCDINRTVVDVDVGFTCSGHGPRL